MQQLVRVWTIGRKRSGIHGSLAPGCFQPRFVFHYQKITAGLSQLASEIVCNKDKTADNPTGPQTSKGSKHRYRAINAGDCR